MRHSAAVNASAGARPPRAVELGVPVFAAVDGDDVLRGVEEPFAVVSPRQGAGGRVGIEFHPEAQALPLFDLGLDGTWAS